MNRTELINCLLRLRNGSRYLEIGVGDARQNLSLIECAHKVGVDPRPVTTFVGTSDEFFAQNQDEFDVVFIDGFHTEEQVSRDISNAHRSLAQRGVIVVHDCMPPDAWHQREPEAFYEGENWNGTVWKAVLREFNSSSYKCTLLDMDWGCGLIDTAESQVPSNRALPEELVYEEHYGWLLEYRMSVSAYLREQVRVFYHLACIGNWQEVFVEQMQQLRESGFTGIELTVLGGDEDLQSAISICEEMNVEPDVVFHSPELSCFEKPAMLAIEEYARGAGGYVLYLHSKGVSNPDDETKTKWRRLMMRELVENWESCALQLPEYDLIGVNWRDMGPISHFCGNFWYASTRYLRKLANFQAYYDNPRYRIWDAISDRRLGCEFWIGSGREAPSVLSLVCRNVDFCDAAYWGQ